MRESLLRKDVGFPPDGPLRFAVVTAITEHIERTYDSIPRVGGARIVQVGPFELFLKAPNGAWPLYARPRLGVTNISRADVAAVRARQRALGVPEAIEWVHDVTPGLIAAVRADGLPVVEAPLMVLDPTRLPDPSSFAAATLALLEPDSPEFVGLYASSGAVASLAFAAPGTAVGAAGPRERDAATGPVPTDRLDRAAAAIREGRIAEAVARTEAEGVLARAAYQTACGAAELVGIATLPAARRRGLAAAVSAFVARHALDRGCSPVFLAAADDDVARVYGKVGFDRIGTACIAQLAH
jgi:GNAT superfamily N-acetyltransferase